MSTPRGSIGPKPFSIRSASSRWRATPTRARDSFESLRVAGKALGLPTSLLIDKDGCELGVVAGPVDWDSDDAGKVVKALKGG